MNNEFKKFYMGKEFVDTIIKLPGGKEITEKIKEDVYQIPVGDLIEGFIKHLTKPWWKRDYNHEYIASVYKDFLNKIEIKHYL